MTKFMLGMLFGYFTAIALVQAELQETKDYTEDYLHHYNQCLYTQTLKGHKVQVAMAICHELTWEKMND